MEKQPVSPQGGMPYGHLEDLLKQNLEVAKENHKILKRMERNALIGFIAKVIIWLIVLGVPIFLLSSYIGPLFTALQAGPNATSTVSSKLIGLPSVDQVRHFLDTYKAQH